MGFSVSRPKKHVVLYNHPMLGECVPKQRYGVKQLVYTHRLPPSIDLSAWEQQYHSLQLDKRDFLFLPFDYRIKKSQGLCCGELVEVDLTYELCPHVLDSELVNRDLNKRYYEEAELWYLLYNTLDSCKDFEYTNLKIGDVRPKNILLTDVGKIKIISRYSWPGEQSGLEKTLSNTGDRCYLAPEELKVARFEAPQSSLNVHKTDCFSIGMTFLELCTLSSSQQLYNYKQLTINAIDLRNRKKSLTDRYSVFFIKVVDMLTDLDPQMRCTCGQVWATLNPYAEKIDKLTQFHPDKGLSQEALLKYKRRVDKKFKDRVDR